MKPEELLKQAPDGAITNVDGKLVVSIDWLLSEFALEDKPAPSFDCHIDPETGKACSQRSKAKLQAMADSHGYILVPRFCHSRAKLDRLIGDVVSYIETMEAGRVRAGYNVFAKGMNK